PDVDVPPPPVEPPPAPASPVPVPVVPEPPDDPAAPTEPPPASGTNVPPVEPPLDPVFTPPLSELLFVGALATLAVTGRRGCAPAGDVTRTATRASALPRANQRAVWLRVITC